MPKYVKLFEQLVEADPQIDPRMGFPEEFIKLVNRDYKLMSIGLLPPTHSVYTPEFPNCVFVNYRNGDWVAVKLDDNGNPRKRNDSDGDYKELAYVNENLHLQANSESEVPELITSLREFIRMGLSDWPIKIDGPDGRLIYMEDEIEDGDGTWFKYEEKDGQTITTGYDKDNKWYKEYVDNATGLQTRIETYKGYWSESQYDEQGRKIGERDSNGKWWNTKTFKNGKTKKVVDPETAKLKKPEKSRYGKSGRNLSGRLRASRTYEDFHGDVSRLHDIGLVGPFTALAHMPHEDLLKYAEPGAVVLAKLEEQLKKWESKNRPDSLDKAMITDITWSIESLKDIQEDAGSEVYLMKIKHSDGQTNVSWYQSGSEIIALPNENPTDWRIYEYVGNYTNADGDPVVSAVFEPTDVSGLLMYCVYVNGKFDEWAEIYYAPEQ